MSQDNLNEAVRTRVPVEMKEELSRIARGRHLKVSDVVREALRSFVSIQAPETPVEPERHEN
ncbi:MAG: ribbon-helix-helix domain-containing protein [Verrucomicrobia bacterium]|nr:ribbon-helix-helix domain-containing protein [Verrucomicrobiota bacterium]